MSDCQKEIDACALDLEACQKMKARVPEIAEKIIEHCAGDECYTHIDYEPIPSEGYVVDLIDQFRELLFPGYFSKDPLDPANMKYSLGQTVSVLYDKLSEQIIHHIRHDCLRYDQSCSHCEESGQAKALAVIEAIPTIRAILATDVRATFEGDPAAQSHDEIIFSYPGIFAIMVHRVAHRLFELGIPLLPRIMSEHAHGVTGIDIHPGATIGEHFFIDHGTGVVIGETTIIGKRVQLYQGVTLGAKSFPLDENGNPIKGIPRHPIVEEDVIIYSGATILGRVTIGRGSTIGGNVWLTHSVPPGSRVTQAQARESGFEAGAGI